METSDALVIVGAGTAGSELAFSARQGGWSGSITLIGEEPHLPYHRPPLSKGYLTGKVDADSLGLKPAAAYDSHAITLRRGLRIDALQAVEKTLVTDQGERIPFSKLALCTGCRPRALEIEGLTRHEPVLGLHYLRTRSDADAIGTALGPGVRLVIIGGGYIGLEIAASARMQGANVTVLETQPRVLSRVTSPAMSAFYEQEHRRAGVDLRTDVSVCRIECVAASDDPEASAGKRFQAVVCGDGSRIAGDVLVIGIGGLPNVELAIQAGLTLDGGIVVDEFARTSDADIFAAGDCTVFDSAIYGRRIRLESVPNALEQARAAASALCGRPVAYRTVPWFWSDQYDLKLQMAGLSQGHDQSVTRGDIQTRSFATFYLQGMQLLAVDAVNRPADFIMARRLMAAAVELTATQLADEATPLKALLPTAR